MKVLVCGSRGWSDELMIFQELYTLRSPHIIHGKATEGADKIANDISEMIGHKVTPFPAKWRARGYYNPAAGFERNILMLEQNPDLVLAFWDGFSRGTKHTIDEAEKRGIPVKIIYPNGEIHYSVGGLPV